jgi:hypothetical protein
MVLEYSCYRGSESKVNDILVNWFKSFSVEANVKRGESKVTVSVSGDQYPVSIPMVIGVREVYNISVVGDK